MRLEGRFRQQTRFSRYIPRAQARTVDVLTQLRWVSYGGALNKIKVQNPACLLPLGKTTGSFWDYFPGRHWKLWLLCSTKLKEWTALHHFLFNQWLPFLLFHFIIIFGRVTSSTVSSTCWPFHDFCCEVGCWNNGRYVSLAVSPLVTLALTMGWVSGNREIRS